MIDWSLTERSEDSPHVLSLLRPPGLSSALPPLQLQHVPDQRTGQGKLYS